MYDDDDPEFDYCEFCTRGDDDAACDACFSLWENLREARTAEEEIDAEIEIAAARKR